MSTTDHAKQLISQKDTLEAELNTQLSILSANNCTMSSPLVDADGFPRSDIDVWAVRHARVRIIELRNDLRVVLEKVAKALEGVYAKEGEVVAMGSTSTSSGAGVNGAVQSRRDEERPFAKVDGVAPSSPAADAVSQLN